MTPAQVPVIVVAGAVWVLMFGYWILACARFFEHVGWWL